MLMIRFQRIGRKNDPAFRIVVLEKTSGPKAGKYVDLVGTYNPKTKATSIQAEKIAAWEAKGAQVSPSVHNLLVKEGVREGSKIAVITKKNLEKHVAKRQAEADAVAAKAQKALDDAQAAKDAEAEAAKAAAAPVEAPAEEVAVPAEEASPAESAPEEVAPAAEEAPESVPEESEKVEAAA
jgi:small subunit ribosomal protein S16